MKGLTIAFSENGGMVITVNVPVKFDKPTTVHGPKGEMVNYDGGFQQKVFTATSVDEAVSIVRDKLLELQK